MKKNSKKIILFLGLILILIIVFLLVSNKNIFNSDKENPINNTSSKENEEENSNIIDKENNVSEFVSKINININGTNYTATLEDNETTREFVKRLPLEINMSELNGNEKYYYFNDSLPSNSSRVGKINTGDLMLYGSDCLVLFYESFNSSYSYTRMGKIDNPSSLKDNVGNGSIKISFTK